MTPFGSKRHIKYIDKSFLITLGTATRWSLDVYIRMQCVNSMRIVFTFTLYYIVYTAFVFVSVVHFNLRIFEKLQHFHFLQPWSDVNKDFAICTSQHLIISTAEAEAETPFRYMCPLFALNALQLKRSYECVPCIIFGIQCIVCSGIWSWNWTSY